MLVKVRISENAYETEDHCKDHFQGREDDIKLDLASRGDAAVPVHIQAHEIEEKKTDREHYAAANDYDMQDLPKLLRLLFRNKVLFLRLNRKMKMV